MAGFLNDMERAFRDMHFPEATQALTGLKRDFGYLVIDRGEICIVGLDGADFDATACAVTVLKASADVAMLDWQKTLYHKCCHITIDLNPDAGDVIVQTPPDIDLARHFDALCHVEVTAARRIQRAALRFLKAPIDLTQD